MCNKDGWLITTCTPCVTHRKETEKNHFDHLYLYAADLLKNWLELNNNTIKLVKIALSFSAVNSGTVVT